MECIKVVAVVLSCIGLGLDMIGVYLLFKWEPPISGFTDDRMMVIGVELDKDQNIQFDKNNRVSKNALVMLLIGFFLQIISTILSAFYWTNNLHQGKQMKL